MFKQLLTFLDICVYFFVQPILLISLNQDPDQAVFHAYKWLCHEEDMLPGYLM